jgi:hypothetical protein
LKGANLGEVKKGPPFWRPFFSRKALAVAFHFLPRFGYAAQRVLQAQLLFGAVALLLDLLLAEYDLLVRHLQLLAYFFLPIAALRHSGTSLIEILLYFLHGKRSEVRYYFVENEIPKYKSA